MKTEYSFKSIKIVVIKHHFWLTAIKSNNFMQPIYNDSRLDIYQLINILLTSFDFFRLA